ncbi:MAG: alpha-ketoglutarate-dependent dioxygenase AlkB [Acidimicrobiales bacterium]|nr:alpha-ketoglutarate-dependent dioxygenase AlkB [Acidimicrobiales bacterium]
MTDVTDVTDVERRPGDGDPTGWLDLAAVVERIDLGAGSWVDVVRGLLPDADAVHDDLLERVTWQQGRVFRYERWIDEPRLSGTERGDRRHPALVEVQHWISRRYRGVHFDGYALARYRHQADSVAFHRDREMRWLQDTVIAVLTLGARRPFLIRPLDGPRRGADELADAPDLAPASGDLLVMGGRCQATHLHAVPKTRQPVRSRISVQWRWTSRRGERDRNPSYRAPRRYRP